MKKFHHAVALAQWNCLFRNKPLNKTVLFNNVVQILKYNVVEF